MTCRQTTWQGEETRQLAEMARIIQDNENQSHTYKAMQLWRTGFRQVETDAPGSVHKLPT